MSARACDQQPCRTADHDTIIAVTGQTRRATTADGKLDSARSRIRRTTSRLTARNRWDHILARCGVNRSGHRVEPGLYVLGNPTPDSSVFVSANYTLSFDALRSALVGIDAYILVLDTQGINVWCAAGKGTFGTEELVRSIEATGLHDVVTHRVLILPQLGAPGVTAHDVQKRSGFRVVYGPVRAADLPQYLRTRMATPEMRRVRFALRDRLVLIPVELAHLLVPAVIAGVAVTVVSRLTPLQMQSAFWGLIAAMLTGVVLFPILLPWVPTRDFSSKGFILGGLAALPFAMGVLQNSASAGWWPQAGVALSYFLVLPPVTAFIALNFTGSTTFTSRTGVRREMFTYVPVMAWMLGIGIILGIITSLA